MNIETSCGNDICITQRNKLLTLVDWQKEEIMELKHRIRHLELAVFPREKLIDEFMDGCDAEMGKSRKEGGS